LRWQVDNDSWLPMIRRLKYEHPVTQALLGKAVRVIRLSPIDNNVIAAGLENGEIQLLDVLGNQVREPLFQDNDRVFDLNFTPDARYLFSGHGSSRVRQWDLKSNRKQPFSIITTNFAITSLAVSQVPSDPFVMIAGRFNQLRLWNWEQQMVYTVPYSVDAASESRRVFQPVFGQNHYIESVAIANTILATADNQGYITVWNWQQRRCTAPQEEKAIKAQTIIATEADGSQTPQRLGECIMPIVDQWADGHGGKPVRSVAITPDGLYLASVGDDGQVKLWFLDHGKRSVNWKNGKVLQQFPGSRLRSVDLRDSKNSGGYIFVTSDAPNNQVRLYREPMNAHASQ
jgi:WD40 repeat protein